MEKKNQITFDNTSRCGLTNDLVINININIIINNFFNEKLEKLSLNKIIDKNIISAIQSSIRNFIKGYNPGDIVTEINQISIDKDSIKYNGIEIISISNANNENLLHFLYFLQYHIINLMIEKRKITSIENRIFSPIPYTKENQIIKINKHYINLVFYLFYINDDKTIIIKSIEVELANNIENSSNVKKQHNEDLLYRKFSTQSSNKINNMLVNLGEIINNIKIINPGLKGDNSLLQKYNSIYICPNNKSKFLEQIVFDLYRYTIIIKEAASYIDFMTKVKELCNIILKDDKFRLFTFKNKMNYPNLYIGINVCFIDKNRIDLSTDPLIFEIQFHCKITYIAKSINHYFYKKLKYFTDKKEKNINDLKQLLINYCFIKEKESEFLTNNTICMTKNECDSIVEGCDLKITTFIEIKTRFEKYLQNQEIIKLIQRITLENIYEDNNFKSLKNSIIDLVTTFLSSNTIKKGGFKKNRNKKKYNNSKKKNKRNRKKIKKSKNTKKYKRNNRKKYL